jgi:RNA polymerase sigma-70 factor, ECF subfamily
MEVNMVHLIEKEKNQVDKWSNVQLLDPDKALELIMDDFGEEIKRFIYTYTKNTTQAEDLTQEVFVNVYLKLNSYNGNSSLKTWLYSIAINKCKDYFKSWHYRKVQFMDTFTESNNTYFQSPEEIVALQAESVELVEKVLVLPIKYREILLLFYYREFSIQEIMQILNINENTAKSRLHRGRQKLKDIFIKQNEVRI